MLHSTVLITPLVGMHGRAASIWGRGTRGTVTLVNKMRGGAALRRRGQFHADHLGSFFWIWPGHGYCGWRRVLWWGGGVRWGGRGHTRILQADGWAACNVNKAMNVNKQLYHEGWKNFRIHGNGISHPPLQKQNKLSISALLSETDDLIVVLDQNVYYILLWLCFTAKWRILAFCFGQTFYQKWL